MTKIILLLRKKKGDYHQIPGLYLGQKKVITIEKLKKFIALTFYFGVVKKDNVKSYWSTDSILSTPFPKKVMSRDEFLNIFSFFHLCDNKTYVKRGQEGYDPRKTFGFFYEHITSQLPKIWWPRQYLSVDEGCIPFKGRIHFCCYNPSKIDKYHMKTFKLVYSTNNYIVSNSNFMLQLTNHLPVNSGRLMTLLLDFFKNILGKATLFLWITFTHLHICFMI